MADDLLKDSKEQWQDASDHYREERKRMLEDLEFSNPANPKQWDDEARAERDKAVGGARPCITLDYTNQYIAQVENDARQNKPGIEVSPDDQEASKAAATELEGYIRQIEYASRADIAYARCISHSARCGKGWLRASTKMVNPALNEQEIIILSVADPLSVLFDIDSTEPDGMDGTYAFVESKMTRKAFKREFGDKTDHTSWGDGNADDKTIRIAERFWLDTVRTRYLSLQGPDGTLKQVEVDDEDPRDVVSRETQLLQAKYGPDAQLIVLNDYKLDENQAKWCKLSGSGVLEELDFPSQYIPVIPVYGHELWIDGKRWVCGLTRQLMDGQRLKNFERSSWVEVVGLQPKTPWIVAMESIAGKGMAAQWADANRSNAAFLAYNALDEQGNALPHPQRMNPPNAAPAYAQGSQMAMDDMQASVGMYRSNFGASSNAVSGRAKLADQREGDTAIYHYQDNRARSISHLGRIIVDMIPRVHDTKRTVRSLSQSGAAKMVQINPDAAQAHQESPLGTVINPTKGKYAVRVKTGPAYESLRQESADALNTILSKNPALVPILGPMWARMQDWPEADHVSKLLLAMAPKPIQDIENQDTKIPPEAQAMVASLQAQIQQMQEAGQNLQGQLQQATQALDEKHGQLAIDAQAAEAKTKTDDLNAQVKAGELALKERELGLREREMTLRELEAVNKSDAAPTSATDQATIAINARKVEIDAYNAETQRIKVELEAVAAGQAQALAVAQGLAAQAAAALETPIPEVVAVIGNGTDIGAGLDPTAPIDLTQPAGIDGELQ